MLIPTLCSNKDELDFDISVYGKIVSQLHMGYAEIKEMLFKEFEVRTPFITLEATRCELGRLANSSIDIDYNSIDLSENESIFEILDMEDEEEVFEENTLPLETQSLFTIENSVTDSKRSSILSNLRLRGISVGSEDLDSIKEYYTFTKASFGSDEDDFDFDDEDLDNEDSEEIVKDLDYNEEEMIDSTNEDFGIEEFNDGGIDEALDDGDLDDYDDASDDEDLYDYNDESSESTYDEDLEEDEYLDDEDLNDEDLEEDEYLDDEDFDDGDLDNYNKDTSDDGDLGSYDDESSETINDRVLEEDEYLEEDDYSEEDEYLEEDDYSEEDEYLDDGDLGGYTDESDEDIYDENLDESVNESSTVVSNENNQHGGIYSEEDEYESTSDDDLEEDGDLEEPYEDFEDESGLEEEPYDDIEDESDLVEEDDFEDESDGDLEEEPYDDVEYEYEDESDLVEDGFKDESDDDFDLEPSNSAGKIVLDDFINSSNSKNYDENSDISLSLDSLISGDFLNSNNTDVRNKTAESFQSGLEKELVSSEKPVKAVAKNSFSPDIDTVDIGVDVSLIASQNTVIPKPDTKPVTINESVGERPTDLRKFLKENKGCTMELALKYFSKKEIEDNLKRGRIMKRNGTLRLV